MSSILENLNLFEFNKWFLNMLILYSNQFELLKRTITNLTNSTLIKERILFAAYTRYIPLVSCLQERLDWMEKKSRLLIQIQTYSKYWRLYYITIDWFFFFFFLSLLIKFNFWLLIPLEIIGQEMSFAEIYRGSR